MKKFLIASILLPTFYYSQIRTAIDNLDNQRGKVFDVKKGDASIYNGIDGSPYETNDFKAISVEGYSNSLPPVRYNIYADEMEFKNGETLNYVDKTSGEMRIKFKDTNKVYLLSHYEYNGKKNQGYLVEKIQGGDNKYGLYIKEGMVIIENQNSNTNSYLKQKNPYFEKQKDITLLSFDNKYYKFPKNEKELKSIVNSKEKQLTSFLKSNKINLNKSQDQEKLISYLNTLQ